MNSFNFDLEKLNAEDLLLSAPRFKGEGKMAHHWNWGMMFVEGEDRPYYYMRSMTDVGYRSGNVVKLGEGPTGLQEGTDFYNRQVQIADASYKQVSDNPLIFNQETKDPYTSFTYFDGGAKWIEGDFLSLDVEFFPIAFIAHKESVLHHAYIQQPILMKGYLNGKKVNAAGCYDRMYDGGMDEATAGGAYAGTTMNGIRKDGRREYVHLAINGHNGEGIAAYWLEGEEPIVTDKVELKADWQTIPYGNDDTQMYTNAVWHFADKVVHMNGKWGGKGHTQKPRIEKYGFSHVYGPFYVGDEPYEHEIFHTICENHNATPENLKKGNFI